MTDPLLRTKVAIQECASHLTTTCSSGSLIEAYLTQHILVILCADVQNAIYHILDERVKRPVDEPLANYASASCRRILRSVRKDEIANLLKLFGRDTLERLNENLNDKDVTIYNGAVNNRHDIAHKQGAQVTFRELGPAVEAAERVLAAVRAAIHA